MITVITGLTGSGKTWLMSRMMLKEWKRKTDIYTNFPLNFPNDNERVYRWHALAEIYHIKNGVIAIDEGQKLFDARLWPLLPESFKEKISSHRHHFVDIITTTQDLGQIDVYVRRNIHELYKCKSIFRFPRNERIKPIIQLISITKKQRSIDENDFIKWTNISRRFHIISRLWTKKLYDTFGNIDLNHFICQIKREKKQWKARIFSREVHNIRRRW